jgi:hypothetical protein
MRISSRVFRVTDSLVFWRRYSYDTTSGFVTK